MDTKKTEVKGTLTASILSLSLLTVMAGAAVAPALGVIKEAFADESQLLIQLIISMPALFIFLTSFIFPALSKRLGTKTLVMTGLLLYTLGGVAAGLFDNIYLLLVMRALVGVGVGIIMPLSTGLLAYFYPPEKQDQLMGYSSAMNMLGGVVATLIAGVLSEISWKAAFLVYLMGLISIVLCALFVHNFRMTSGHENKEELPSTGETFKTYYKYIIAMFFLTSIFFVYPSNFAIETASEGTVHSTSLISVIMAFADVVGFFGGFFFGSLSKFLKNNVKFLAPVSFLAGYAVLFLNSSIAGLFIGSAFVGLANGAGVPFIIAQASMKAGKQAAATVMPMLTASLYLGQFLAPFILSALSAVFSSTAHLSYIYAGVLSICFIAWSFLLPATSSVSVPHAEKEQNLQLVHDRS